MALKRLARVTGVGDAELGRILVVGDHRRAGRSSPRRSGRSRDRRSRTGAPPADSRRASRRAAPRRGRRRPGRRPCGTSGATPPPAPAARVSGCARSVGKIARWNSDRCRYGPNSRSPQTRPGSVDDGRRWGRESRAPGVSGIGCERFRPAGRPSSSSGRRRGPAARPGRRCGSGRPAGRSTSKSTSAWVTRSMTAWQRDSWALPAGRTIRVGSGHWPSRTRRRISTSPVPSCGPAM